MAGWSELLVLACVRRIIRKLIDHVRKSLTLEFWWLNTEMKWKEINLCISALAWKPKWMKRYERKKKEVLCQIGKPNHWIYSKHRNTEHTHTHVRTYTRTHFVDSCGLSTYCCSVIAVAKPNVIPLWKKQQRKNNNNNNFTEEEKKQTHAYNHIVFKIATKVTLQTDTLSQSCCVTACFYVLIFQRKQ